MIKSSRFLLENSPIPIYQRIVENLSKTLRNLGHEVVLLGFNNFQTPREYIDYINECELDYCLITNFDSRCASFFPTLNSFLFENFNLPLIFIHHDNLCSAKYRLVDIHSNLQAFINVNHRSFHFCLEYSNFIDLKTLGIDNVFMISHASEFKPLEKSSISDSISISFVGHLTPGNDRIVDELSFAHLLKRDYWQRVVSLDATHEESAYLFANKNSGDHTRKLELFSLKFFYRAMLHQLSQPFRGEIIGRINDEFKVGIFGGDPAYINNIERNLQIIKKNLNYYPATSDYQFSNQIYSSTKINLNISSLQFDTAVINRVIDIGSAGGFVLTDWKSDLHKITSVSEEISFRSIDELNSKIDYYLTHDKERREIAIQLHHDVVDKCSYHDVVTYILSRLTTMNPEIIEPVKVDLGCGSTKPSGFIGVDIGLQPGVDIVADLNRRFPFADSSVDFVRAHDTVEHLQDRLHTMNEIWRICKPEATVEILVPSTDGRGAFQDPTHISYWNINSFKYYCVEYPSYLQLCQRYGFKGYFSVASLEQVESEDQVIHVLAKLIAIKENESLDWMGIELQATNIIIFVNWMQSEENLYKKLLSLFQSVVRHSDLDSVGFLFYLNNQIDANDARSILFGVIMDLCFQEDFDEPEHSHIEFIPELSHRQWEMLLPHLSAKIELDNVMSSNILYEIPEWTPMTQI